MPYSSAAVLKIYTHTTKDNDDKDNQKTKKVAPRWHNKRVDSENHSILTIPPATGAEKKKKNKLRVEKKGKSCTMAGAGRSNM